MSTVSDVFVAIGASELLALRRALQIFEAADARPPHPATQVSACCGAP